MEVFFAQINVYLDECAVEAGARGGILLEELLQGVAVHQSPPATDQDEFPEALARDLAIDSCVNGSALASYARLSELQSLASEADKPATRALSSVRV